MHQRNPPPAAPALGPQAIFPLCRLTQIYAARAVSRTGVPRWCWPLLSKPSDAPAKAMDRGLVGKKVTSVTHPKNLR